MSDQRPSNKRPYYDILKSIDDFFKNTYDQLQSNPLFLHPIPVRIVEKQDYWIAEAELPGIDKNQIKLDIHRQSIRIQVFMNEEAIIKDDKQGTSEHRQEAQMQQRVIPVPFYIDEKDVKASYKNGLLKIIIPNKRRQIQID